MALRQNLHDYVADQIRNKIISRRYASGVRLPNEYQLAAEYDVCRYTVREAIKKLTATGLVEVRHGCGTFVRREMPSSYFKNIIDTIILEDRDVEEIFIARIAIEQMTARLAARNASSEGIDEVEQNIRGMEICLCKKATHVYNRLDLQFHCEVAKLADNKILVEVLSGLHDMIRHAIQKTAIKIGDRHESLEGHKKILQCIRLGDQEGAAENMISHLEACRMALEQPKARRGKK
jgi:GntR family transcriptional repressor for pyruvate dehydrogenase complex